MPSQQNVVLVIDSRLLRGILKRAIQHEDGLNVVAEVDDLSKFNAVIDHAEADWIVLAQPQEKSIPEVIDQTLIKKQDLNLLIMAMDGSHVRLRRVETHETALDDKNLQELLSIMRDVGVKKQLVNFSK